METLCEVAFLKCSLRALTGERLRAGAGTTAERRQGEVPTSAPALESRMATTHPLVCDLAQRITRLLDEAGLTFDEQHAALRVARELVMLSDLNQPLKPAADVARQVSTEILRTVKAGTPI